MNRIHLLVLKLQLLLDVILQTRVHLQQVLHLFHLQLPRMLHYLQSVGVRRVLALRFGAQLLPSQVVFILVFRWGRRPSRILQFFGWLKVRGQPLGKPSRLSVHTYWVQVLGSNKGVLLLLILLLIGVSLHLQFTLLSSE